MSIDPKTLMSLTEIYETLELDLTAQIKDSVPETEDPAALKLVLTAQEFWNEIKIKIESSEWYHIMIDGEPGSGKTTIGREFCHLAHQDGFKVLYTSSFDLFDAPLEWREKARGARKVCIFIDDMSYTVSATSQKMQSKIKRFMTMLRHALRTSYENPQIFLIVAAHFVTAVPPVLKNTNYWIFPNPKNLEYDTMQKLVGKKPQSRQQLEKVFGLVKEIWEVASPGADVSFNAYGHVHPFFWDVDGRLSLLLKSDGALMYHSRTVDCDECEKIGKDVHVGTESLREPESA